MAQPTPYDRQFNFQNQQLLTPADPPPADEMDAEFDAIKLTLDQILAKLGLIQRDDGALLNQSVSRDTLHSSIQLGFGAPAAWRENTRYVAGFDTVFHESYFYSCVETHVSDPSPLGFDNDLAKWALIADFSASAVQGLGTLSTQNADNVVISGGTISGTAITVDSPDAVGKVTPKSYVDDAISTLSTTLLTTLRGELNAPSGTRMLFQQTSAPTGWTKDVTHNDKALRLVNGTVGSGGVSVFSTVFGKTATDAFTLTATYIPSHQHGGNTGSGGVNHTHSYSASQNQNQTAGPTSSCNAGVFAATTGNASAYLHTHTIPLEGGGTAHSHGMDLRVQYVDAIIASKD